MEHGLHCVGCQWSWAVSQETCALLQVSLHIQDDLWEVTLFGGLCLTISRESRLDCNIR